MKIPAINWIPFNSDDPPTDLHDTDHLIFYKKIIGATVKHGNTM